MTKAVFPDYTIRRSLRAKYIKLHIHPSKGLELVLPRWASEKEGLKFLRSKRDWVLQHFEKIIEVQRSVPEPPDGLLLPSINRCWKIRYTEIKSKRQGIKQHADCIYLNNTGSDIVVIKRILVVWLKRSAHLYLTGYLQALSQEIGLPYGKLSFRDQKTLWGSCSYAHNISLNFKLLFLPEYLMRYVMIHELSHTKHFNHSKRFWSLVESFEPRYQIFEKELKQAEKHIPAWCL